MERNRRDRVLGKGIPKIIVPLVGKTEEEILTEAVYVKGLAPDVVEWRADIYENVENPEAVKALLEKIRAIFEEELLLFTFRSHLEGGSKEISEAFYVNLNETAIRSRQIDLIDIELFKEKDAVKGLVAAANENDILVIMSNHDFSKTPPKEEIISRLCQMKAYGADVLKIAVMPQNAGDVLTLLDATYTMKKEHPDCPLITMSMAGTGVISRLAGEVFGSDFTFAAGKEASAPGQVPVDELRAVLNILHKRL
ncbi:type I 3-dehydroquinate dehydratase [Pradoshia sp.]